MKRFLLCVISGVLLLTLFFSACQDEDTNVLLKLLTITPIPQAETATSPPTPVPDFPISMNSPYAGLYSRSESMAIFEKNADKRMYPASITKVMTVLVALEQISDLQTKITLDPEMFNELYEADASVAGFLPGEEVSAFDLLYGALLPSGAECCIGIAEYVAGSEEAYVDLMNQKAEQLGLTSTHFVNTSGLHDEDHYTTVRDLASLLNVALEDGTFRDIFTSRSHSTQGTNLHPDGITFYSTMFAQLENASFEDGEILGGKTGYTSQAGMCLASLAEWNGEEYILVTAGAARDEERSPLQIQDAIAVYSSLDEAA